MHEQRPTRNSSMSEGDEEHRTGVVRALLVRMIMPTERDDAARAQLERIARRFPGLQYAMTDADATRFEFCSGFTDVGARRPVQPSTLFMAASCTKVVTADAIRTLVDRGCVVLARPLSDYYAEHPYGRDVTVGHLLAHTGGVPNPLPINWLHPIEEELDEDRALASVLRAHPNLRFTPGTRYAYSNLGYWLLGKVIERASGSSYTKFVQDEVLGSLGIAKDEIGFAVSDIARLARGYERAWSPTGLFVRVAVRRSLLDGREGPWLRFARVSMNGAAYGGAFATARGFCAFLRAQLARPPSVVFGWRAGELMSVPWFSKPGGGPGFCGNVRVYPSVGIATAWFANRMAISERQILELADAMDRIGLNVASPEGFEPSLAT